jgi:predicted Zn-dependent protease
LTLAQVYLAVKQFENAELMAEQAATVGGGQSDPFSLMAQAQIGAGRSEDALVSISKAAKVDPEDRAIKLNLAELQMRAGDRAAAKETLATIDSSLMDDLVAGARLVVLQFELGDLDLAIRGAKELARRFPDSGIHHVLLGEFYYGAERFPAAVREFNTAMDINLTEPIAVRAYMQMLRHDLSNPTAPLDRLLKKEPDNYRVRMMVAEYYQRRAKHEVAIEQYETVIRQNPESWIAMNNLSISYLARGRPEALAMAKRAFELAPDNNSVMDTYGWVLFKNGAVEEGLKILQEVSGKSSGNSEIQFHLAQALAETGQTNEAKLILDQILVAGNEFSSRKEAQHLLESIQ